MTKNWAIYSPEQALSRRRRVPSRPRLHLSYRHAIAMLNTPAKQRGMVAVGVLVLLAPVILPSSWTFLIAVGFAAAVGALGLNLLTGYAGQVSLGHAFFLGLGAYTAAVLGGATSGVQIGLGLPMVIWLPASGAVAGIAGYVVSPIATRLRGLYLAVATLALVMLGRHFFLHAAQITGGTGVGRRMPRLEFFGFDLGAAQDLFGLRLPRETVIYLFMLFCLLVAMVTAKNVARSATGRRFMSIRDHDIAASMIGIDLRRQKSAAFALSSVYAGTAGALLYAAYGYVEPGSFSLLLSIQYIAMIFIGGLGTISGSVVGAVLIISLSRISQVIISLLPAGLARSLGTSGSLILEGALYGALIIAFLLVEPNGVHGIWSRVRTYWRSWPFTY